MKIEYKTGDLFQAPELVLIHGCNAQGVMGSGVARLIKALHPDAFANYRHAYETKRLALGDVIWAHSNGKLIANAITQKGFGPDGLVYVNYEAIAVAITEINLKLTAFDSRPGVIRVALPRIGAGLGGGDWAIIEELIELSCTHIQPVVYTPAST